MGNWIDSVVAVRGPEGATRELVGELRAAGDRRSFIEVLLDPAVVEFDHDGQEPCVSPGEDRWEVREDGDLYLTAYMKNRTLYWWAKHLSATRPHLVLAFYAFGVHGEGGGCVLFHAGQPLVVNYARDQRWSSFFAAHGLDGVRMWWEALDEEGQEADDPREPLLVDVAGDTPRSPREADRWALMDMAEREGWSR